MVLKNRAKQASIARMSRIAVSIFLDFCDYALPNSEPIWYGIEKPPAGKGFKEYREK
ncbi:MAG: hypothetical protein JNM14_03510 [Ferruginibacter sp.]|nr:hypothetical protein [Ferruginibacter sp.]